MKKRALVGLLLLLLVVGLGTAYRLSRDKPKEDSLGSVSSNITFKHQETGVTFDYPETSAILMTLTVKEQQENIIFRATEKPNNKPFLVTLRYEEGLRIAASLAKLDAIELVLDGANKANPTRYPNYKKISERRFQQDNKEAAEIIFTYKGPSEEMIKQRLVLIAKDDDSAFYLALQSRENVFAEQNSKIFETIASTLKL